METLNMSKLNLSSVQIHASTENDDKSERTEPADVECNVLSDSDEEYQCAYDEDIWNNLLEQEAQKPVIHLQSPQLEFRGALVAQLRAVSGALGLGIATLHAAVAHLDLFMDAHRLRPDRLSHVALACLSLAAKSEEKFSVSPGVGALSRAAGMPLSARALRRLEWAVARHARWRLLRPTPASFALRLARCVVTRRDLAAAPPALAARLRRDARCQLRAYLDLTLSDVRLKVLDSVVVGAAAVAGARAALGLPAWPPWLPAPGAPGPTAAAVLPVARLLLRMMQIVKSGEGDAAARLPEAAPAPPGDDYCALEAGAGPAAARLLEAGLAAATGAVPPGPPPPPHTDGADYGYRRAARLLEAGLAAAPGAVPTKRALPADPAFDAKRFRLSSQISQVVL